MQYSWKAIASKEATSRQPTHAWSMSFAFPREIFCKNSEKLNDRKPFICKAAKHLGHLMADLNFIKGTCHKNKDPSTLLTLMLHEIFHEMMHVGSCYLFDLDSKRYAAWINQLTLKVLRGFFWLFFGCFFVLFFLYRYSPSSFLPDVLPKKSSKLQNDVWVCHASYMKHDQHLQDCLIESPGLNRTWMLLNIVLSPVHTPSRLVLFWLTYAWQIHKTVT